MNDHSGTSSSQYRAIMSRASSSSYTTAMADDSIVVLDASPPPTPTKRTPDKNRVYLPKINPEKLAAIELLEKIEEENNCIICTEPLSLEDEHHIVALKCGHIFGKSCIEEWLRPANRTLRCPTCNHKASRRDAIKLYSKCVRPSDPRELTQLRNDVTLLRLQKMEADQRLQEANARQRENEKLKAENEDLKMKIYQYERQPTLGGHKRPFPRSNLPISRNQIETIQIDLPKFSLKHLHTIQFRDKARCHSFSQLRESLFASVESESVNPLFPARYGIRRIPLDPNGRSETVLIHDKLIRDMFIDEIKNSALTVSSDKTLKITSLIGNQLIGNLELPNEGYSVHINSEQQPDHIYVGLKNGEVQVYDQRNLRSEKPIETMCSSVNKVPVASLQSLSGYTDVEKNNSLILAVHLSSAQLYVHGAPGEEREMSEYQVIKLPWEGKTANASYDRKSNRVMLSLRASPKTPASTHYIFNYDKGTFQTPNLLTRLVGSTSNNTLLTRSKLFSHPIHDDYVIAAANGPNPRSVRFWNVDDQSSYVDVTTGDDTRDIEFIDLNNRPLISCLSEGVVKLYKLE